jgi:hypothetical protein
MFRLIDKRFSDYFRDQPETGMGYWITTVHLKDGRHFPQAVVSGGCLSRIRHHDAIPFLEVDIDCFEVTHDKWDWQKSGQ